MAHALPHAPYTCLVPGPNPTCMPDLYASCLHSVLPQHGLLNWALTNPFEFPRTPLFSCLLTWHSSWTLTMISLTIPDLLVSDLAWPLLKVWPGLLAVIPQVNDWAGKRDKGFLGSYQCSIMLTLNPVGFCMSLAFSPKHFWRWPTKLQFKAWPYLCNIAKSNLNH